MKKEKMDKLAAAFEEAGLRLVSVHEQSTTNLWSEGDPNGPFIHDTPKQKTEVFKHVSIEAVLL